MGKLNSACKIVFLLAFVIEVGGRELPPVIAAEPIDKEAYAVYAKGVDYKKRGQFKEAVDSFSQFAKLVPASKDTGAALLERADCYRALGTYKLALPDYAKAASLDPKLAVACQLGEAACYLELQETQSALSLLTNAIAKQARLSAGERGSAYLLRGNCYKALHRWNDAIDDYNRAVEVPDCKESALFGMSESYFALKKMRKALTRSSEVLWIDPRNAKAFKLRGQEWYRCGEFQKAVQDFTLALRFGGGQADVYTIRADSRSQLGDKEEAIEDCTEAIRLSPANPSAYRIRAGVYYDMGDDENAISDLSKAIALSPKEKRLYLKRAEVYEDMKEAALAARDRQVAQTLSH